MSGIEERVNVVSLNVRMGKIISVDRWFSTSGLRACVG
jgi:hypothetical protein